MRRGVHHAALFLAGHSRRLAKSASGSDAVSRFFMSTPLRMPMLRSLPMSMRTGVDAPGQRHDYRFAYCVAPNSISLALSSMSGLRADASTSTPRTTAGRAAISSCHRFTCGNVVQFDALVLPRACPRKGGNVSDRVVIAGKVLRLAELLIHHAVQATRLVRVAVDRVFDRLRRINRGNDAFAQASGRGRPSGTSTIAASYSVRLDR